MTKEASQKRHVHDECGSSIVAEKKRAEGEQKRVLSIRRSFSEKGGAMRELSGDERTKVRTLYALATAVSSDQQKLRVSTAPAQSHRPHFFPTHFISTLKFVRHINKACSLPPP